MDISKLFRCSSSTNISKRNNSFYLKFESEKGKKYYKSRSKNVNKKKQIFDFDVKNNYKLIEIKKINFVNNQTLKNKRKNKIINNINNASIPVNYISKKNKNVKCNFIKNEKKKTDLYTQNKDISGMKEIVPKTPELFNHDYNYENKKDSFLSSEKLNKGIIPAVFYNHLMVSENNKYLLNAKKKYLKSSITQRNKNKMLTIIYYSPKPQY